MTIDIQKYRFQIRFCDDLQAPAFLGNTLRGGFGYAFRRISCALVRQECPTCLLRGQCVYTFVFETAPPKDTEVMRRYETIPHPFIIEPPDVPEGRIPAGAGQSFHLMLVGRRAMALLPYFVYAFIDLGETGLGRSRSKFALEEVAGLASDGTVRPLYNPADKTLATFEACHSWDLRAPAPERPVGRLRVAFASPFRVRYEGALNTREVPFHVLVRNLLRRASALSLFHCNDDLRDALDFRGLIRDAEKVRTTRSDLRWVEQERYSTRQQQRMNLGGIVGTAEYEGNITPFVPLLRLGELCHVGKGTSFGHGKYSLQFESEGV